MSLKDYKLWRGQQLTVGSLVVQVPTERPKTDAEIVDREMLIEQIEEAAGDARETVKLDEPLHWRRPARVFVNSMSDLFHEALPDAAIDRVFATMIEARNHTFQILTKRPERMRAYFSAPYRAKAWASALELLPRQFRSCGTPTEDWWGNFSRHIWLGVSVEDQATADERIPHLLATPAAVRFVSYEPALGPVDFGEWLFPCDGGCGRDPCDAPPRLDWLIVGGESGPGARPCDVAWIRSAVAQCKAAGVACFVKQLGARPYSSAIGEGCECFPDDSPITKHADCHFDFRDRKGGDPSEWPEDLRVREFPR